jgi:hypothetical protein
MNSILDGSVVERILTKYHNDITTKIVKVEYEGQWYEHKGIPSFLYTKFDAAYDRMLNDIIEQAENIINDNIFHAGWEAKLTGMLDVLDFAYRRDFSSLDSLIKTLNGDLDRYFEIDFLGKLQSSVH